MTSASTGAGTPLRTVSLRRRLTAMIIAVLAVVLVAVGLVVDTVYSVQSERTMSTLLSGRVQVAKQLARNGVGPQALVNRVDANGVRASLVLRNGTEFGQSIPTGDQVLIARTTLSGTGRIDGAKLTLAIDTALVDGAHRRLRRILLLTGLVALLLSALLVTVAVRLALRPLDTMSELARTIADGQRGTRLKPTRTDTELGQTAAAFDDMLDELEGAEARARSAEARTRAFLDDAAHELRTPISGVQAAAETLLQHGDQLSRAEQERMQVLLIQEARRAGALVSDLLAAARLDAGVELDRLPMPLLETARAELDRLQLLHPDLSVTVSGAGGPLREVIVDADAGKVGGIVSNLLENAARAAGPGGWIQVVVHTTPSWAFLDVLDSGPGVSAADRERIFDRLVRLDHDRGARSGGSGLGLAIARGYARAHGGELTCEEPPAGRRGACFRLALPRTDSVETNASTSAR